MVEPKTSSLFKP